MKKKQSIWNNYSEITNYPSLTNDISADVAVIGGGITGISTAKLLAEKGMKVVVLESHNIGGVSTGRSTGNLYITIDKMLSSLQSMYDSDAIKKVAMSRLHALNQIRAWIQHENISCDYAEVPMYLYSNFDDSIEKIEQEMEISEKAGLPFQNAAETEIPYPHKRAIKAESQNQINPVQYVQELARSVDDRNCSLFEDTHVHSVEDKSGQFELRTKVATARVKYVVHATHTPKGVMPVQTLLGPYREYGIACSLRNQQKVPDGIFWGYHEEGKKYSTRIYKKENKTYLIVIGQPHKVGQDGDNTHHLQQLEKFARQHFKIREVEFQWGGQHYRPADLLPYIGPKTSESKEFIATGYSTDGLVYGTLAGMILSDSISGKKNEWSQFYDSTRHQPFKAAPEFIKENVDVANQFIKDRISTPNLGELDHLEIGDGQIIKKDDEYLAVSRDEFGRVEIVSAVCTHMKCIVHWNKAEHSWDCPCHGSRFDTDGTVLEGPALEPLKKAEFKGEIKVDTTRYKY